MLETLKDAFSVAFKKPLTYIALVAIPLIVLCFAALYFSTFINPVEQLQNFPVAVINQDEGAEFDGEKRNFGDELVESIMEDDTAKWVEEDPAILDSGLENSGYDLAIIIPADFSERVCAGETREPEQANLTFFKNQRDNYMLTTLMNSVEKELESIVSEKITEQYAHAFIDGLVDAEDGFTEAADGSAQLADGITTAGNGSSQLESGLSTLVSGAESLQEGIEELASGAEQLQAGSEEFTSSLNSQKNQLSASASTVDALQQEYAQALQAYTLAVATDPSSADPTELNNAVSNLAKASSATGAYSAIDTVETNYAQLDEGIREIATGTTQLQSGSTSLTSGAASLLSGASSLTDGLSEAQEGTDELTDGLEDGASTIESSLTDTSENLASYTANPVDMEDSIYGELGEFGYGFAPLFISLSLWLGALLIFFIFDPFPSSLHLGANRLFVLVGRWPLYLILSALEVLVVYLATLALGLPCTDEGLYALLLGCMAFSFMVIMQFLNLFDIPGKAVSVLLVIIQIVFCSGTFPAALASSQIPAQCAPWLPFTYSIDAIREVMSGGVAANVWPCMGMLLLFALCAFLAAVVVYPIALKAKTHRDAATVKSITGVSFGSQLPNLRSASISE